MRAVLFYPVLFCLVACHPHCRRAEKVSDGDILKAAFPGGTPQGARVLVNRRANLDDDLSMEVVAVIRHGDQERLCFLGSEKDELKSLVSLDFSSRATTGIPPRRIEDTGDVIRRIVIRPIGDGSKLNSVFVEYLLDDPDGRGPVSHIMIFSKLRRSYDSAPLLADHPVVRKERKVEYVFTEKDALILFPTRPERAAELRFNGLEIVEWRPGYPFPHFSEFQVKPAGASKEITLILKNLGDYSPVSYISLGFPAGGNVEFDDKEGLRLYRPGQRVYNRQLRAFVPAEYPLLEVTRTNWRSHYRTTVKFRYTPKDGASPVVLVRVAAKRGNDIENFPPEKGVIAAVRDQQGFRAYAFPVQSVVMP